ncbi:MAG: hypothetical protein HFH84_18840 [Lachnospiraceae bacterium]|nr:hypothetical protein [Lachnospiraceae bacterium]
MKIIKYLILGIWTLWFLFGISQNYSHYEILDWIILISLFATPYLIIGYLKHRNTNEKNWKKQNINKKKSTVANLPNGIPPKNMSQPKNRTTTQPVSKQPNTKRDSAIIQLESVVPKSRISYVEDNKMIARTDGKKITDEEVPYLVQVGREEAIAKWKLQELTRLIPASYQIMQITDNPETLCSRYNFIVEKMNELASLEQQVLFDSNILSQYKALISDDSFYNLIMSCYQKYTDKARTELKTQNGINNRINKFWETIRTNVSVEFYNSKFRKT